MPNKHPRMKLSRDEETFLRHWMYDELHYRDGAGRAKQLQLQHRAIPVEIATIIAAAIPDLADQMAAGEGPPPEGNPIWPWSEPELSTRLAEARMQLRVQEPAAAS